MNLRLSDKGWNRLVLHNHSIRWLIGDVEIAINGDESKHGKVGVRLLRMFTHSVVRSVMLLIGFQGLAFLVNKYCHTLFIQGEAKGYLEDLSNFGLVLSCIIALLTLRHMLRNFHGAFLSSDLAKRVDPEKLQSDYERYQDILGMNRSSGYIKWAVLTFGSMALMIYFAVVHMPLMGWQVKSWSLMPSEYPWNYVVGLIEALICWYCVGGNLIWYGVGCAASTYRMLRGIRKREKEIVIPVSPDRSSGFYVLAQFSFALFLMCLSTLPFILAHVFTYGITLPFTILFPIALLLMGTAFFLPLWPAHSLMKMAKEKELKRISELFEESHDRYRSLKLGDESMEDILAKVTYLETLYGIVKRMPVWPFNTRTLARFLSLILIQFIPFLIKILSNSAVRKVIASWWKGMFG